ncbi:MAG: hypothetical protein ACO3A4_03420 [Silvanigrellaceae bacterium]
MDTRLLRLWSNCKSVALVCLLNFVGIFVCQALFAGRAEAAAMANGELAWNGDRKTLDGEVIYSLPQSVQATGPQTDSFWLLPNRDLVAPGTDGGISREQREFVSDASGFEWPFADEGLGALLIKGVKASELPSACPATPRDLAQRYQIGSLKDVDFEFQDNERILLIRHKTSEPRHKSSERRNLCRFVVIRFEFHPRLGNGNFAQFADGDATFSGPVYPVWQSAPVFTQLSLLNSRNPSGVYCNRCAVPDAKGKTNIVFHGLPPPIHFRRTPPESKFELSKFSLDESRSRLGTVSNHDELRDTLEIFNTLLSRALVADGESKENSWRITLMKEITIEQLVTEQAGEIQLHGSFGKVTPILSDYHSAALFRALARSFARHVLSGGDEKRPESWKKFRQNEFVARILAELWLQDAFPRLSFLKNLSDRFSFLPFFRAVQQGNAFVNNAVFVGGEETGSRLDYSTLQDFISPMKGSELLERMNACADEDVRNQARQRARLVQLATQSAAEFAEFLTSTQAQKTCIVPMDAGILPTWVSQEKIEIQESEKKRLKLSRAVVRPSPTTEFFLFKDAVPARDTLQLSVVDKDNEALKEVRYPEPSLESLEELNKRFSSVEVMSPNRAVAADRLVYPRPIKTVVQALALNYDSRRSDVTLRSQFQTLQVGDLWNRTLQLGWRREYEKNFLDLTISSNIPSIIKEARTTIAVSSTTQLEEAPPSFLSVSYAIDKGAGSILYPEGTGLKIWLRRPLTLTALKQTMSEPEQEWLFSTSLPLAPRLTWSESFNYGLIENPIDVGLRSVPGWPAGSFKSQEYLVMRSELRNTLAQNLNASVASSILFQHITFYSAHVVAFDDLQAQKRGNVKTRTAQAILAGIRLFGALFGAKDQALGIEVARALAEPGRTSFGLTLGRSAN